MTSILLTGATGFLGSIVKKELVGFNVASLGRNSCDFNYDLANFIPTLPPYDLVIHAAGKAHIVPKSPKECSDFYRVNVTGTENLLRGLENSASVPSNFVLISTVAVYGRTSGHLIDEDSELLATDPYGRSKILAENLVQDWAKANRVRCTILRLPLIAGPNPVGNLASMIRGIERGYYFNIAGGGARKSMVLGVDVARILHKASMVGGVYNLTDGVHPSFSELSKLISEQLKVKKPKNMPYFFAKCLGKLGDTLGSRFPFNTEMLNKITNELSFDDSKARNSLEWNPTPVLEGLKIE